MAVIRSTEPGIPGTDPRDEKPAELPPVSDEVAANPVFQAAKARFEKATAETTDTETDDPEAQAATPEAQVPAEEFEDAPQPDESTQPTETGDPDPAPQGEEDEEDGDQEPPATDPSAGTDQLPSFTYAGQEYQPADVERMVQLDGWARSLPEWGHQAIDALFSGQYQLVPVGQAPAPEQSPPSVQGQGQATPTPTTQQPELTDDDLADLPPAVAATLKTLNERVQSMASLQEQQAQAQLAAQRDAVQAGLLEGQARFQTTYELTDAEISQLQADVIQAGVLPVLGQQHPGQPAVAMEKAMEQVYWVNANWRQRELQRIANNGNQDPNVTSINQTQRKARKASALNGNSGSAPRVDPSTTTPATKEGRRAAMTAAVREEMFGANG